MLVGLSDRVMLACYQIIRLQMADKQACDPHVAKMLNQFYPDKSSQLSLSTSNSSLGVGSSPSKSKANSLGLPTNSKIKMVEIKKEDHTIRNTLILTFVIIMIILCIDLRNGISAELHKLELEANHCYTQHTDNECDNPVEIMREKCKELRVCYSTPVDKNVKITQILSKLVGQAVRNVTTSAGLLGTIFLLVLICAIFYFAYKSSKAVMIIRHD